VSAPAPQSAAAWDTLAGSFEDDVFSVWASDRRGVLRAAIAAHADPAARAADLGCGTGRGLPVLARRFAHVHGIDFAPALVAAAARRTRRLRNVTLHVGDVARADRWIRGVRLAVAVNVLLAPTPAKRTALLAAARRTLAPRGVLVLVVPALESVLLALAAERATRRRWTDGLALTDARGGIARLGGATTKCHTREELVGVARAAGFRPLAVEKIEYPWRAEYPDAPQRLAWPPPWDWLAVLRR
jgi:SAM-dependent methyltransferase